MYRRGVIVCTILSLTCAQRPYGRKNPNELIGGRDPKFGEVKYIVAIHSYRNMCGGGIIDKDFILTTAHCVKADLSTKKLLRPMRIIAGTNVVQSYNKAAVIEIDVEEAYLPTVYKKDGHDDIAVLKLKKSLDFIKYHDKLQKLNLPEPLVEDPLAYPTYENVTVKFAGYGNTRADIVVVNGKTKIKRSDAGRLKVAKAFINDAGTCKKYFVNAQSNEMCLSVVEDATKKTQQGTCTGDSGSPAVYNNNVVIGVDSKGLWCDNNKAPSLFTRVSSYIPFIKKAINGNVTGLIVYKSK